MNRIQAVCVCLILAAPPATATEYPVEFTSPRTVLDHVPLDRIAFGEHTLVKTADSIVLIDWSRPRGFRERVVVEKPLAIGGSSSKFAAWGDSVVALAPFGEGGHLILHPDADGNPLIESVADPDWRPPSCRLAGQPYFAQLQTWRLDLVPALGAAGDTVPVEHDDTAFIAHYSDHDGDRLVFAAHTNERGIGAFQVWDLSEPDSPRAGAVVTTGEDEISGLILDGNVMYLGAGLVQAWDISDVDAPMLLDEIGPRGYAQRLALGPDSRLVEWQDHAYIRVLDIADPSDLRNFKSYNLSPVSYVSSLTLEGRRVVVGEANDYRQITLPVGWGTMDDGGLAWPSIYSRQTLVASDGRLVWIQDEGRLLADMAAETLVSAGESILPGPLSGVAEPILAYRSGHLIYAPGDGRVVIEDVSDPRHPVAVCEFGNDEPIHKVALYGDRMALRSDWTVLVFDITEPAVPQYLGGATITGGATLSIALLDDMLAVAQNFWDGYSFTGALMVFEIRENGMLVEASRTEFDPYDWRTTSDMAALGTDLFLYANQSTGSPYAEQGFDLSDPGHPVDIGIRGTDDIAAAENHVLETGSDRYVVTYDPNAGFDCCGILEVGHYEGFLPVVDPAQSTVEAPGARVVGAAEGDRVFLIGYDGVYSWRVSNIGVSGTLSVPGAATLRIAPNPFNPATVIAFDMDRAGVAQVEIFDLRGRRMRSQVSELPIGPARQEWDGRDDAGRDLPSGVYLMRVTTPTSTLTGRATLLR